MKPYGKGYEDYYLVKCFEKEKYRTDFNSGKIYLNPLSFFPKLENEFQQDNEGLIFRQPENGSGALYTIDSVKSNRVSELMKSGKIQEGIDILKIDGNKIAETKEMIINVNGFLSCFYLIPKVCLHITENTIDISPANEYEDFFRFLNNYSQDQGYSYFSIYDASKLIERICTSFQCQGYNTSFGTVTYKDIDEETKINWLSENQVEKVVFTKPLKFKYQREFRFFVCPQSKSIDGATTINVEALENCVISSLAYLTPEYYKKLKEG